MWPTWTRQQLSKRQLGAEQIRIMLFFVFLSLLFFFLPLLFRLSTIQQQVEQGRRNATGPTGAATEMRNGTGGQAEGRTMLKVGRRRGAGGKQGTETGGWLEERNGGLRRAGGNGGAQG